MNTQTELAVVPLHAMARRLRVPKKWLAAEARAGRIPCLSSGTVNGFLFAPHAVEAALATPAASGKAVSQ